MSNYEDDDLLQTDINEVIEEPQIEFKIVDIQKEDDLLNQSIEEEDDFVDLLSLPIEPLEEELVGQYKAKKYIAIEVYSEYRSLPHFHFYKDVPEGRTPSSFEGGGCICIDRANYFPHDTHLDLMTNKEVERLVEFLKEECIIEKGKGMTNWGFIVYLWNEHNRNTTGSIVPDDLEIPKYRGDMPNYRKSKQEERKEKKKKGN